MSIALQFIPELEQEAATTRRIRNAGPRRQIELAAPRQTHDIGTTCSARGRHTRHRDGPCDAHQRPAAPAGAVSSTVPLLPKAPTSCCTRSTLQSKRQRDTSSV